MIVIVINHPDLLDQGCPGELDRPAHTREGSNGGGSDDSCFKVLVTTGVREKSPIPHDLHLLFNRYWLKVAV